jgi:DNA-binding MarR family transcriptional regulator
MAEINKSKAGRSFGCPEEDAFVSLWRTADLLSRNFEKLFREADISPTQYNVLRILRGAPEGLPCSELGKRMITRDPDITRLLDRLEKRSLIARSRDTKDRRMVLTRISSQGQQLLRDLDHPVTELHKAQLSHLGRQRLHSLMGLLEAAREKVAG